MAEFVPFIWPWWEMADHHAKLLDYANQVCFGESRFVAISIPPRHSKSQIFSVALPAFYLGNYPDRSVIHVSHTLGLSTEFSFELRQLARDDYRYRRLFPHMRLHREKRRLDNWKTTSNGGFRSFGAGGGISGLGANLMIIDDIVKEGDERSPARLKEIWDWYSSAARTRLMPGGSIVVVMTRWSEDDLVGRLKKLSGGDAWEFLELPALALADDALGREPGAALWPRWYDVDYLEGLRKLNEPYFAALYQQDPRAGLAHPFERDYFKLVNGVNRVDEDRQAFWFFDLAITEKESADFTAWARFQIAGDRLFVSRMSKQRCEWPEMRQNFVRLLTRFPDDVFILEHRNIELMAVQSLQQDYPGRIRTIKMAGDKMARANGAAPVAASGRILMVAHVEDGIDRREEMINELVGFPGEHDDWVDVLSGGVHFAGFDRLDFLVQAENKAEGQERLRQREIEMMGRMA